MTIKEAMQKAISEIERQLETARSINRQAAELQKAAGYDKPPCLTDGLPDLDKQRPARPASAARTETGKAHKTDHRLNVALSNAWESELAKARAKAAHADKLAECLRGVQWKIQVYSSHWEPSQAEREAIAAALAAYEAAQ